MPDRIVRDELLRSHRYRTLTSDTTRLLFVHLLLHADSLGNCEATTTALGDAMGRQVDEATATKWLDELSDVDLVRVYVVGLKRYCHIPRFRQRLRYPNGKHPRPPAGMECSEIRELAAKVRPQSDQSQTTVRPQSAEVKRSEVKRSEERPLSGSSATNADAAEILDFLNAQTGSRFKHLPVNLDLIKARIKEGHSVSEIKAVIASKVLQWKNNDDMRQYLRPETLFRAKKFAQYVGAPAPKAATKKVAAV